MPFITEELWHAIYEGNLPAKSIALSSYPVAKLMSSIILVDGAFRDGVLGDMQELGSGQVDDS